MRLFKDKKGATAIEYALLAALVGVGGSAAFSMTGTSVKETYCAVASRMPGGQGGPCGGPPLGDPWDTPGTEQYALAQRYNDINKSLCEGAGYVWDGQYQGSGQCHAADWSWSGVGLPATVYPQLPTRRDFYFPVDFGPNGDYIGPE